MKTFFKGGIRKKYETLNNLTHIYFNRFKSYLLLPRIKGRFQQSKQYRDYLVAQMAKSVRIAKKSKPQRANYLIEKIAEVVPKPQQKDVLCIGCRNNYELDLFEKAGFKSVRGIDLFTNDPRITVMDMHCMEFDDTTFGLIYSCHSLEHSYDHTVVVSQMLRVLKPNGYIAVEVPIQYKTTHVDLHDFGSFQGLIDAFEPHVKEVLFKEEEYKEDTQERLVRIILEMK